MSFVTGRTERHFFPRRQFPFGRAMVLAAIALFISACTTLELTEPVPTSTSEKYAAIVVDARNGRVLHAAHAYETRYPASLTKMMTLYLLFEAMETGRVTPATQIPFSVNASRQPPSKLGVKAGMSIDAETAIRALAVKSANDVAVAVAEHLAGSEEAFARAMTLKARQLGMNGTVFTNASGLPDERQVTTAHDMAILGMALRKRFPGRYHYFSMREFNFNGRTIKGHNHLLGTVAGVDGIKTGYTRASGYNLASSVNLGGRSLVAVVMGEDKGKMRDAHMEALIAYFLPRASRH
ncbi:D-alanyl-D-alanine carboxypeptidase family protein [Mesorhizobium sp. J18]|uniref:D-alanyl-D-alanine carboxypeptidase family protein n=1 Tax=Mesorhizobium sp. J18 TaxID=935263 RepID=UPI001FEDCBA7|nr:D-alanyl-D-alanine carboxypeptidase family protein [Mesorhizobium sp. J18]